MNRMDGKICVIAGATQGLGAAIARRLAAAEAAGIVVTGRNEARGKAVAEGITAEYGAPALFLRADLGSVEDCRRVIEETDKHFGHLHVLVNAGALTERGTLLNTTPELFDRIFATNVRGPFFLMQSAIKLMIRDGIEGAICNVGSISALSGQPYISPYCASKGALTTLTANTAFSVIGNATGMPSAAAPQTDWSKLTMEPVISPASSETRKFTARAASSGSTSRPKGRFLTAVSIQCGSPFSAAWSSNSWSEAIHPTLSWLTPNSVPDGPMKLSA